MWQAEFASALRDADTPPPPFLRSPGERQASRRFDVYRNNVYSSLVNNLYDGYPVVAKLVGEAFFKGMASCYVRAHLPQSPVMVFYGEAFGDFIDEFSPASGLPYLGGVARLEYARRLALHSADQRPLNSELLSEVPIEQLLNQYLTLHPSVQIVESDQPIHSIWLRNMPGMEHHEIPGRGETVLVRRLAQQVEERLLPAGGAQFFAMIQSGHTLGQSSERIIEAGHGAELSELIRIALESSVRLSLSSTAKPTAS